MLICFVFVFFVFVVLFVMFCTLLLCFCLFCSEFIFFSRNKGVMSLIDMEAAFPSISHQYLWHVLDKMGLPPNWIRALTFFYQDSSHFLQHEGSKIFMFNVQSGVRQGCPLSPVLFALALDPFIRKTLSLIFPLRTNSALTRAIWPLSSTTGAVSSTPRAVLVPSLS